MADVPVTSRASRPIAGVVSLGTTHVRAADGTACTCAIAADGSIVYGIRTTGNFPQGHVLGRSGPDWFTSGRQVDIVTHIRRLPRRIPRWQVVPSPVRGGGWFNSGELFDGQVEWCAEERPGTPRSPACREPEVLRRCREEGNEAGVTTIAAIDFDLRRVELRGASFYEFGANPRQPGGFRCRYNGLGIPPERIPRGTLVAVFLADHAHNTPLADGRYWYLKIGSVLGAEVEDEPLVRVVRRAAEEHRWLRLKLRRSRIGPVEEYVLLPWAVKRARDGDLVIDATHAKTSERRRLSVARLLEAEPVDAPERR